MQANSSGVKSFGVYLGPRREIKYYRRLSGPMLTHWEISRRIRRVSVMK